MLLDTYMSMENNENDFDTNLTPLYESTNRSRIWINRKIDYLFFGTVIGGITTENMFTDGDTKSRIIYGVVGVVALLGSAIFVTTLSREIDVYSTKVAEIAVDEYRSDQPKQKTDTAVEQSQSPPNTD